MNQQDRNHDGQHLTGTAGPGDEAARRTLARFSRHQRVTITQGILLFVLTLVLCQLWLFSATMNAYLGGDASVVWPGAIASVACLALNAGLLRHLYVLERRRPSSDGSST